MQELGWEASPQESAGRVFVISLVVMQRAASVRNEPSVSLAKVLPDQSMEGAV